MLSFYSRLRVMVVLAAAFSWVTLQAAEEPLKQRRIAVSPEQVTNDMPVGDPSGLVDEQHAIVGPPAGRPNSGWSIPSAEWKNHPGFSAHVDLGEVRKLATLWIFDTHGIGDLLIEVGEPGKWELHATYPCNKYMEWSAVPMEVDTRYVRFTCTSRGANFTEVAFYEYTPEAWEELLVAKAAAAKAEAERQAALAEAREEMKKRPLVDVGPPFGKLYLIDEINLAEQEPMQQSPADISRVETILGKPSRVLPKTEGEAAYMSYRIGRYKLLKPGMTYVLEVEYPEDAPRSVIVLNGANEAARGFSTGRAFGDALHPKYVNNLPETLDLPLSGEYETWQGFFHLHDRTPELEYIRGSALRKLTAEDGFTVTIAQFSARNIPFSQGAAVSRIRLLALPDASEYDAVYSLPEGVPTRRLFWREEMADGVVNFDKEEERGTTDPLDWWRFKRNRMKFLGMNTYSKDLLEFGAVQHWDTSDYGGHDWMYFNVPAKDAWGQIVEMMGEAGFDILPYYEYHGGKGREGLGFKKRAMPLTRDDAYTHIKWVENARADLTDPDAYEDFKKMLDATIIRYRDKANFVGAWIRTRGGMPMGFGDETRRRFAEEANDGVAPSRQQLIDDEALLARYKEWWFTKRRDFFVAMRDYLREAGIDDAEILYTAYGGEPGVAFKTWQPSIVTDDPAVVQPLIDDPAHAQGDRTFEAFTVDQVAKENLYLQASLAERLTWGGWEVQHQQPPPRPDLYKETDNILTTMAINRHYTVADPDALEHFSGPGGLALIRHFSLNENMAFDKEDQPKLGYFIVDFERAGPYSMMAEAVAMANGNPTHIGYLSGSNYTRGFPHYVRNFNTAFLSLPALPAERLDNAASASEVVVKAIKTEEHGTWLAIINTSMRDQQNVRIKLPVNGNVTIAATGEAVETAGGSVTLSLYPFQLQALRIH